MSIYTNTARFDTGRALTEEELRKIAPSVFAVTAHESRSDRFAPIPTIEILRGLRKEGFEAVGAKQAVARIPGRADFTKHLIRIRRMGDLREYSAGDTVCEMLLKNANDGTAAYDLMAGLFRIQCLNSMVAQISTLESVKVKHTGDVAHKVIEGTFTVIGAAQKALAAPDAWSRLNLNPDEKQIFAEQAHALRFGDSDGNVNTPIRPDQIIAPRRRDDIGNDLWRVFNVAQENAIRGGMRGIGRDANNRRRRVTTREIHGIDQDVKLNRALFALAAKMAELKGAPLAIAA